MSVGPGHVNAKSLQRRPSIWQQAFAASLVDGRLRTVGHQHPEPSLARRNRRCQSRGAAPNHENIGRVWHALAHVSALVTL